MRIICGGVVCLFLGVSLVSAAHGRTAQDFCGDTITDACLDAIADHMIATMPDTDGQRAGMVRRYVGAIAERQPDRALELITTHGAQMRAVSLRLLAVDLAALGMDDAARMIFRIVLQNQRDEPENRLKVLNLLFTAGEMHSAGFLDLVRETHRAAAEFLPTEIEPFTPFSDHLRLARLMWLYGWPEDSAPWLAATYDRIAEIPEGTRERGMAIASFAGIAWLMGDRALADRAVADLADFYRTAPADIVTSVRNEELRNLAEAGFAAEAHARATAYGLSLDIVFSGMATLFLDGETDYVFGMFPSTEARFEGIVAALDSPDVRDQFRVAMGRHLIEIDRIDDVEALLLSISTPAARSEIVLALMRYIARDLADPARAAALYFSAPIDVTPPFARFGTYLQRGPLADTAIALWESGDTTRAAILSETVRQLWIADETDNPHLHSLLISALAEAGQYASVDQWLDIVSTPQDRIEILEWAARGAAKAGDFDASQRYLVTAESVLPEIPDTPPSLFTSTPPGFVVPTERETTAQSLAWAAVFMIREMARQDLPDRARAEVAARGIDPAVEWRTTLDIAQAEARAGAPDASTDAAWFLLDKVLSMQIAPDQAALVITALMSDAAVARER